MLFSPYDHQVAVWCMVVPVKHLLVGLPLGCTLGFGGHVLCDMVNLLLHMTNLLVHVVVQPPEESSGYCAKPYNCG